LTLISFVPQFAESSSSGISSLGINGKAFLFNLITFVIVLMILRRWVFPKLVATLEARRKTLEDSLIQAKETEAALERAEAKAEELLAKARAEADVAAATAKQTADGIIAKAETEAGVRAERIVKEAEARLSQERDRLHQELRKELAALVVTTTEKVLHKKMDEKNDRQLIEDSLKDLAK
jgi:F-type H+-transporting ATPase subunit b